MFEYITRSRPDSDARSAIRPQRFALDGEFLLQAQKTPHLPIMVSGAFFQTAVSVIVPKGDSRGNDGAPVDGLSKLGTARSEHFNYVDFYIIT